MSDLEAVWKQILRRNFTRWDKLAEFLELDVCQRELILAKPKFSLNLPFRLASKIEKKKIDDPILIQFLPTVSEKIPAEGFCTDPVGDVPARCTPKLLSKYSGRVLLIVSSACAMHCRYCFRQNFDYGKKENAFEQELAFINSDQTIHEVILSGGDPLSLGNSVLSELLSKLDAIGHVKRIRFHTRFPIGIPERIDDSFLELLNHMRKQIWFVIHCNHPRELDEDVLGCLRAIQKTGALMMNQAVLLRGVNDSLATLKSLCEMLVDQGIIPYYLHQLDRVHGAAHFEVPEEEGIRLIRGLESLLPGYAIPKYVKELSGYPGKINID